jgi:hypothetical protein
LQNNFLAVAQKIQEAFVFFAPVSDRIKPLDLSRKAHRTKDPGSADHVSERPYRQKFRAQNGRPAGLFHDSYKKDDPVSPSSP